MTSSNNNRIPDEELAEHWYGFMHRLMGSLQRAFTEEAESTGLTQKDIAERLGKSPATVSRCLSGQRNMTVRTMHDLARGMGCRLEISLRPLKTIQPANRPAHLEIAPAYGRSPARSITAGQARREYTLNAVS